MIKRSFIASLLLALIAIPLSSPAQTPAVTNGLNWLGSTQSADGRWPGVATEEFVATATATDTLFLLNPASSTYNQGLQWLTGQPVTPTDLLARRIVAAARAGHATAPEVAQLLALRDSSSWGGASNYRNNILDTALALQALKAANVTDATLLSPALTYLTGAQNLDGGWGFVQGEASNVYLTALVAATLQQYATRYVLQNHIAAAVAYLQGKQNPDGSFGAPATAYETALAFIALLGNEQTQDLPLQNAVNFLTATQSANGSWHDDPYATALALRALGEVKPDLVVTAADLSMVPAAPLEGTSLIVSARLRNRGLEPANLAVARLYDGSSLLAELPIANLAPGAESSVDFPLESLTPVGAHSLAVIVALVAGSELRSDNNRAELRLWVAGRPDLSLAPEALIFTPAAPLAGTATTLSAWVPNRGESPVGTVNLTLYHGDPRSGGSSVAQGTLDGIAAGSAAGASLSFTPDAPGPQTFCLAAAIAAGTPEVDSENNLTCKSLTVRDPAAGATTDLALATGGLRLDPARPHSGDATTVTIEAMNLGAASAVADLELFDGAVEQGGTLVKRLTLTLNPGESRSLVIPWSAVSGRHTLVVYLDRRDQVVESDETNNRADFEMMSDMVDVLVSANDLVIEPSQPLAGDAASVTLTVHNAGIEPTGAFAVALYNGDPTAGGALLQSFELAGLDPDATAQLVYPLTAARGTYRFYVVADSANAVSEFDEGNNLAIRSLLVKDSSETQGPDLVPLKIELYGVTQDTQTLRISGAAGITVQNQGDDKVTTPYRVTVFEDRNSDGAFDAELDNILGSSDSTQTMWPNGVAPLVVPIDGVLTFRDAPLYAMVDSGDALAEAVESNNLIRRGSDCENRPEKPIEPVVEWRYTENVNSAYSFAHTPVVVNLTDDNGDGRIDADDVPDLLLTSNDVANAGFVAFDGATREILFDRRYSLRDPTAPYGEMTAGDFDNDGKPEFALPLYGRNGLAVFEHDGARKWEGSVTTTEWNKAHSNNQITVGYTGIPAAADIDGDGQVELLAGGGALDAATGAILWGYNPYALQTQGNGALNSLTGSSCVAADLDLDGKQEVVCGKTAHRHDGSIYWNLTLNDGVGTVGNFDDDPYPEIVHYANASAGTGQSLYLLEHDGTVKWGPIYPGTFAGVFSASLPVVADFDGDDRSEIGFKGQAAYYTLDQNGKVKQTYSIPYQGDGTYSAPTVFDLNGDGRPEVIVNSDRYFRIFDGPSGAEIYKESFGANFNSRQNVVVADIDGDRHAEIIVIGLDWNVASLYKPADKIRIYGARNNDWADTRGIWNQSSYHVTNVNDDGTIPRNEAPSWLLNNNYRCNVPVGPASANPYLSADLTASLLRVNMAAYPATLSVTAWVGNGGAKTVTAGVPVALFDGDPATGGVLLGTTVTSTDLAVGQFEEVVWSGPSPAAGPHSLLVLVDPSASVGECDRANNLAQLAIVVQEGPLPPASQPDLAVAAEDIVLPAAATEGTLVPVAVTVRNRGSETAASSLLQLFVGHPAQGGSVVGSQVVPVLAAGAETTVPLRWDSFGFAGRSYLYAVVDAQGTVAELDEGNNLALREVTVAPAVRPDLQIESADLSVAPLVAQGGEVLTVTLQVHNRGTAVGNVEVALYDGDPAAGRLLSTQTVASLIPAGGGATVTFAVDSTGWIGTRALVAVLDPRQVLVEADETNNLARLEVWLGAPGVALTLSADRAAYQAHENVSITLTLTEQAAVAHSLAYRIAVEDAAGNLVTTVVADNALLLAARGILPLTLSWNTGTTLAGDYRLAALVTEAGRTVGRAVVLFTIVPQESVAASVTVDRSRYGVNESVVLTTALVSQSANRIFENLDATLRITDPKGVAIHTASRTITLLTPGQRVETHFDWNTGIRGNGVYLVTLEVRDAAGVVRATATCNLTIDSVGQPAKLLNGALTLDRQSILSGEPITVAYRVTNVGNVDLADVALTIQTVAIGDRAVYHTLTDQASLPLGGTHAQNGQIATRGFGAMDYLVVLLARIDGVEETLAGSYFRVEGAPTAAALVAPSNGSDVQTFTPTLVVSNAADPNDDRLTYEYELYADSGLTTRVAAATMAETAGTIPWLIPQPLQENQTYYWRVRAFDGQLYGPWMGTAAFRVNTVDEPPTAPGISSPADGTAVAVLTPTLSVTNASDPDSSELLYNFDVAFAPDFSQIVASVSGVASGVDTTSWTLPDTLAENGWYFWRAQADDLLNDGPWSDTVHFQVNTANDPPTMPVLVAPAAVAVIPALATEVIVANSVDPDSTVLSYLFEADTTSAFDSPNLIRSGPVVEGQVTTSWALGGLLDNTRYFLRVKASDGLAESPWSATVSIFVNTANDAPSVPSLDNPSHGSGVNLLTPTLSVRNATDLDGDPLSYVFEVYADAALTSLVAQSDARPETSTATVWTLPVALTENQTYFWRARATDGALASAWMASASFMVNIANDAPGAPQLAAPADNATVNTLNPVLEVVNAVDPDGDSLSYDFELYSNGSLVAALRGVPEGSAGTTTASLGSALADNSTYTWRARAFDGDRYGAWMTMASFVTHLAQASIYVEIEFTPETLNRHAQGQWVLVKIELPHGYRAADVDLASIRLQGTVSSEARSHIIGRGQHAHELTVRFRRSAVAAVLPAGRQVPVHVTGIVGTTAFEGVDIIKVLNRSDTDSDDTDSDDTDSDDTDSDDTDSDDECSEKKQGGDDDKDDRDATDD